MRWLLLLLIGARLHAQPPMPVGIVRGELVSRTATEIAVRGAGGLINSCFYDRRTYFERDRTSTRATALLAGDPVEVLADRQPGSAACYARTVHVIDLRALKRAARVESPAESFTPRGDLLFGGVVLRRGAASVTLKTRDGEVTLLLRPDTRYWRDGLRTAGNALVINTRVFVHAGRDFEGNFEIYQASWGAMFPAP